MRPAAIVLNLIVPGAGLILLDSEVLGVAVALVYGATAEIGLLGLLLIPLDVPRSAVAGAFVAAGLAWVTGQWLQWRLLRQLDHDGHSCGRATNQ